MDTIVALATAPGKSGIGIIRLSGSASLGIVAALGARGLQPRLASYRRIEVGGQPIDSGLFLHFPAPHSFTGEDVVEIQAHGSPVTLRSIIRECIRLGARHANPGEFSQRAFLNDRIDLVQAEAIADLIAAGSEKAALAAHRSLDGAFSKVVDELSQQVVNLRKFVEAAIDFVEEEIDFLSDSTIQVQMLTLLDLLDRSIEEGRRGQRLLAGLNLSILGAPNAGKSSLLNFLAGKDRAIVTDIAGTTRDLLTETIDLDGLAVTLCDTAGLNPNPDPVERIGIERAIKSAKDADHLLVIFDDATSDAASTLRLLAEYDASLAPTGRLTLIANKIDLSGRSAGFAKNPTDASVLAISVKAGLGLDLLIEHLKELAGVTDTEPAFYARARHIDALSSARDHLKRARAFLVDQNAGELVAEELNLCHQDLQQITGKFSSDDLLGEIFSSFCVGK